MPIPTAVASQCVEVTTPKVPSISGRVVNGFGLTKFMGISRCFERDLTTVRQAGQPPSPGNQTRTRCSSRLVELDRLRRRRCGHLVEHPGPGLDVLDDIAHQRGKRFLAVMAAPFVAAIEIDVMASAALGERMPFAYRVDRHLRPAHRRPTTRG